MSKAWICIDIKAPDGSVLCHWQDDPAERTWRMFSSEAEAEEYAEHSDNTIAIFEWDPP